MKTVFLSFHFDDAHKNVAAQVQTLVESHDLRPITGEHLGGGQIAPEVRKRIETADALIAIAMPDHNQPRGNNKFNTHDWIGSELDYARAQNKAAAVLLHEDAELGAGIYANAERIAYRDSAALTAFLKLSSTLGVWKAEAGRVLTVALLNEELHDAVDDLAGDLQNVKCEFRLSRGNEQPPSNWTTSYLRGDVGAIVAFVRGVQDDDLVEIRVRIGDVVYYSRAEPQLVKVQMKKKQQQ